LKEGYITREKGKGKREKGKGKREKEKGKRKKEKSKGVGRTVVRYVEGEAT